MERSSERSAARRVDSSVDASPSVGPSSTETVKTDTTEIETAKPSIEPEQSKDTTEIKIEIVSDNDTHKIEPKTEKKTDKQPEQTDEIETKTDNQSERIAKIETKPVKQPEKTEKTEKTEPKNDEQIDAGIDPVDPKPDKASDGFAPLLTPRVLQQHASDGHSRPGSRAASVTSSVSSQVLAELELERLKITRLQLERQAAESRILESPERQDQEAASLGLDLRSGKCLGQSWNKKLKQYQPCGNWPIKGEKYCRHHIGELPVQPDEPTLTPATEQTTERIQSVANRSKNRLGGAEYIATDQEKRGKTMRDANVPSSVFGLPSRRTVVSAATAFAITTAAIPGSAVALAAAAAAGSVSATGPLIVKQSRHVWRKYWSRKSAADDESSDSSDEEDVKPADEKQRLVQERVSEHVPAITSARASPRADATAQRVEPRVSQKKKASPEIIDSKLLRSLERGQEHGAENLTHLDHLKPVEPSPKDTSSHAQPVEPPANLRADITLSEPNVDPKSAGTLPVTRIEALAEHVEPSGQKVGADTSATHSPPDKSASRVMSPTHMTIDQGDLEDVAASAAMSEEYADDWTKQTGANTAANALQKTEGATLLEFKEMLLERDQERDRAMQDRFDEMQELVRKELCDIRSSRSSRTRRAIPTVGRVEGREVVDSPDSFRASDCGSGWTWGSSEQPSSEGNRSEVSEIQDHNIEGTPTTSAAAADMLAEEEQDVAKRQNDDTSATKRSVDRDASTKKAKQEKTKIKIDPGGGDGGGDDSSDGDEDDDGSGDNDEEWKQLMQDVDALPSVNVKPREMTALPKLADVRGLDVTSGYQRFRRWEAEAVPVIDAAVSRNNASKLYYLTGRKSVMMNVAEFLEIETQEDKIGWVPPRRNVPGALRVLDASVGSEIRRAMPSFDAPASYRTYRIDTTISIKQVDNQHTWLEHMTFTVIAMWSGKDDDYRKLRARTTAFKIPDNLQFVRQRVEGWVDLMLLRAELMPHDKYPDVQTMRELAEEVLYIFEGKDDWRMRRFKTLLYDKADELRIRDTQNPAQIEKFIKVIATGGKVLETINIHHEPRDGWNQYVELLHQKGPGFSAVAKNKGGRQPADGGRGGQGASPSPVKPVQTSGGNERKELSEEKANALAAASLEDCPLFQSSCGCGGGQFCPFAHRVGKKNVAEKACNICGRPGCSEDKHRVIEFSGTRPRWQEGEKLELDKFYGPWKQQKFDPGAVNELRKAMQSWEDLVEKHKLEKFVHPSNPINPNHRLWCEERDKKPRKTQKEYSRGATDKEHEPDKPDKPDQSEKPAKPAKRSTTTKLRDKVKSLTAELEESKKTSEEKPGRVAAASGSVKPERPPGSRNVADRCTQSVKAARQAQRALSDSGCFTFVEPEGTRPPNTSIEIEAVTNTETVNVFQDSRGPPILQVGAENIVSEGRIAELTLWVYFRARSRTNMYKLNDEQLRAVVKMLDDMNVETRSLTRENHVDYLDEALLRELQADCGIPRPLRPTATHNVKSATSDAGSEEDDGCPAELSSTAAPEPVDMPSGVGGDESQTSEDLCAELLEEGRERTKGDLRTVLASTLASAGDGVDVGIDIGELQQMQRALQAADAAVGFQEELDKHIERLTAAADALDNEAGPEEEIWSFLRSITRTYLRDAPEISLELEPRTTAKEESEVELQTELNQPSETRQHEKDTLTPPRFTRSLSPRGASHDRSWSSWQKKTWTFGPKIEGPLNPQDGTRKVPKRTCGEPSTLEVISEQPERKRATTRKDFGLTSSDPSVRAGFHAPSSDDAMLSEPDERAEGHSTGIYHRIRSNPNMTESSIGWGRFVVLMLAVASGGSECTSLVTDVARTLSSLPSASRSRLSVLLSEVTNRTASSSKDLSNGSRDEKAVQTVPPGPNPSKLEHDGKMYRPTLDNTSFEDFSNEAHVIPKIKVAKKQYGPATISRNRLSDVQLWMRRAKSAGSGNRSYGTFLGNARQYADFNIAYAHDEDYDRMYKKLGDLSCQTVEALWVYSRAIAGNERPPTAPEPQLREQMLVFEELLVRKRAVSGEIEVENNNTKNPVKRGKKGAVKPYESCLLHIGCDSRCEICRRINLRLSPRWRGSSSLMRGRFLGWTVIVVDLKDYTMMTSFRGNRWLCCSNVYADADWDEEDEKWRYTNDLGIDVPMGHKSSKWMKYAFSVIFLEARIQRGDAVIIYFDNEGGVCCIDTVDYLVEYGCVLLNSLPYEHLSTAESHINVRVNKTSKQLWGGNLNPRLWDDVHEAGCRFEAMQKNTMVPVRAMKNDGEAVQEEHVPWVPIFNQVKPFRPGSLAFATVPAIIAKTRNNQGRPRSVPICRTGLQWNTSPGVRVIYPFDGCLHRTVVKEDSIMEPSEPRLAFNRPMNRFNEEILIGARTRDARPGVLEDVDDEFERRFDDFEGLEMSDDNPGVRPGQPHADGFYYWVPCSICGSDRETTAEFWERSNQQGVVVRCDVIPSPDEVDGRIYRCSEPEVDYGGDFEDEVGEVENDPLPTGEVDSRDDEERRAEPEEPLEYDADATVETWSDRESRKLRALVDKKLGLIDAGYVRRWFPKLTVRQMKDKIRGVGGVCARVTKVGCPGCIREDFGVVALPADKHEGPDCRHVGYPGPGITKEHAFFCEVCWPKSDGWREVEQLNEDCKDDAEVFDWSVFDQEAERETDVPSDEAMSQASMGTSEYEDGFHEVMQAAVSLAHEEVGEDVTAPAGQKCKSCFSYPCHRSCYEYDERAQRDEPAPPVKASRQWKKLKYQMKRRVRNLSKLRDFVNQGDRNIKVDGEPKDDGLIMSRIDDLKEALKQIEDFQERMARVKSDAKRCPDPKPTYSSTSPGSQHVTLCPTEEARMRTVIERGKEVLAGDSVAEEERAESDAKPDDFESTFEEFAQRVHERREADGFADIFELLSVHPGDDLAAKREKLVRHLVKVTKTLTKKEAREGEWSYLDWDAAVRKEATVFRNHSVFGEVVEDGPEVRQHPKFNVARLLTAWAVKGAECPEDAVPRVRGVYGGNDARDASGAKAVFERIASLPASLHEVRLFLLVCVAMKWDIFLGDIEAAYLNAQAPPGSYVEFDEVWLPALNEEQRARYLELKSQGKKVLVELLMALYGHELAGPLWENHFFRVLEKIGFERANDVAPAMAIFKDTNGKIVAAILVYVDDFLLGGSRKFANFFCDALRKSGLRLKGDCITGLGKLLGCDYEQINHDDGLVEFRIDMRKYGKHLVEQFEKVAPELTLKKEKIPADPKTHPNAVGKPKGLLADLAPTLIGGLTWYARCGMATLSAAVNQIAQCLQNWTTTTDAACRKIYGWIKNAAMKTVLVMYARAGEEWTLLIHVDADHAGDVATRKSVSGINVYLVGYETFALINWVAKSQKTQSLSTGEAEMAAIQLALKMALEALMFLELFGISPKVMLCSDSTAGLAIAASGISTKMRYASKTQGLSASWVKNVTTAFGVKLRKIDTKFNSSDIQTKGLDEDAFMRHQKFAGIVEEENLNMLRCSNSHMTPMGMMRCKNRVPVGEPDSCPCRTSTCDCWYGVDSWDVRYDDKLQRIERETAG